MEFLKLQILTRVLESDLKKQSQNNSKNPKLKMNEPHIKASHNDGVLEKFIIRK